ncbi:MAG: hypothetical protein NZT61_04725 [Deltaproteobacteria bacterium]|nr:hypothetical protein [Deltaproteobacteria bacterium]MCX7953265.1 hypothetical protein [Deltaproteobacteria bacterium]
MALFDIRHFVTPFKNRLNLVIILAVALVFAIYRTSTSKKTTLMPAKSEPVIDDIFLKELEKVLEK